MGAQIRVLGLILSSYQYLRSTMVRFPLGYCPLDWRTSVHWNIIPTLFRECWLMWYPWKIVRTTFQCIVVLQSRGQNPNSCYNFMHPGSLNVTYVWRCSAIRRRLRALECHWYLIPGRQSGGKNIRQDDPQAAYGTSGLWQNPEEERDGKHPEKPGEDPGLSEERRPALRLLQQAARHRQCQDRPPRQNSLGRPRYSRFPVTSTPSESSLQSSEGEDV